MAKKTRNKNFLILAPVTLLLGAVVLVKTMNKIFPCLACAPQTYSGKLDETADLAVFRGEEIPLPQVAGDEDFRPVLGVAAPGERWVEVDLSEQKLKAWDGGSLFLETPVSTGLPWWPTPTGEFHIWVKLRYSKMEGGHGRYYYYLPNVPYVMYFENGSVPSWRGFGLHGTYWHNDFGRVHSHGCVNLPTPIAEKLYWWTTPVIADGKSSAYASADNPGTRIVIHE